MLERLGLATGDVTTVQGRPAPRGKPRCQTSRPSLRTAPPKRRRIVNQLDGSLSRSRSSNVTLVELPLTDASCQRPTASAERTKLPRGARPPTSNPERDQTPATLVEKRDAKIAKLRPTTAPRPRAKQCLQADPQRSVPRPEGAPPVMGCNKSPIPLSRAGLRDEQGQPFGAPPRPAITSAV